MSHRASAVDSSLPRPPSMFAVHPFLGISHPLPSTSSHRGPLDKKEACSQSSPLIISTSVDGARLPPVPLRQRHLPASFWQEPNRPRGAPRGGSGGDLGGLDFGESGGLLARQFLSQGATYRDFLARLAAAEVRHDPLSSRVRFPITEFLYYNYGLKQRLGLGEGARGLGEGGRGAGDESQGLGASCPHHRHDARLWPHHRLDLSKTSGYSSSPSLPCFTPVLCPFQGCPCLYASIASNSSSAAGGKADCWRLGSGFTSSKTGSEDATTSPWKPLAPKSVTAYPLRFHPFAHDR